jgi:membrane-associated phospholipid phosphatase
MVQDILAGIIVGICVWFAARMVYRRFRSRRGASCDCGCDGCSRRESCDSDREK